MKRTVYIGASLQPGTVRVGNIVAHPQLLPGQVGVMFVYESQAAANAANDTVLITAEIGQDEPVVKATKPPKRGRGGRSK